MSASLRRTQQNLLAILVSALLVVSSNPFIGSPPTASAEELTQELIERIQRDAAEIRELTPRAEVSIQRVSQEELRVRLAEELSDQETLDELAVLSRANALLGLTPPGMDLHQTLVDLLSGAVVGQYRFKEKRMYLIAAAEAPIGAEAKITVAHEYIHALQDQNFDIGAMVERVKDQDDWSLALRALIEGDATISELIYAREHLAPDEIQTLFEHSGSGGPSMDSVPFILREELRFPYNDGFFFVIELWQEGGYDRVNAAYHDPPTSTEQVMHPQKFFAGEPPIEVGLPDLLPPFGPGWRQAYANVMGELELRILIENFTDSAMGTRAAEGWGGDAYAILEGPDGRMAWLMDSVWDAESEAREFYDAFSFSLLRRFGPRLAVRKDEAGRTIWESPAAFVGAARWGPQLAIVYAPELSQVEEALDLLAPQSTAPRLPVPSPTP